MTHVVIKNIAPPQQNSVVTAKLFPIIFETDEPETALTRVQVEAEDFEDQAETKVIKPRRGRRPAAASEVAETK